MSTHELAVDTHGSIEASEEAQRRDEEYISKKSLVGNINIFDMKKEDFSCLSVDELSDIIVNSYSQMCVKCKYRNYYQNDGIVLCMNDDNKQEYLKDRHMQVTDDFSCNKWTEL